MAEVHLAQVHPQDVLFGVGVLQADGVGGLPDLASERGGIAGHGVLDQLLGDGRAAFHDPPGEDVGDRGPDDGRKVQGSVLEEAVVLDGQHGLDGALPVPADGHDHPVLTEVHVLKDRAVPGEDGRALREGREIQGIAHLGQVVAVDHAERGIQGHRHRQEGQGEHEDPHDQDEPEPAFPVQRVELPHGSLGKRVRTGPSERRVQARAPSLRQVREGPPGRRMQQPVQEQSPVGPVAGYRLGHGVVLSYPSCALCDAKVRPDI